MNRPLPRLTTAAEGLPRRAFTVAELEQMVAAGILDEDERFELIGGEVAPMSPKGNHHEVPKVRLNRYWVPKLPSQMELATETTFRLTPDTYLEPDFALYLRNAGIRGLSPATTRLVVEIADLGPDQELVPTAIPELAVTLGALDLR